MQVLAIDSRVSYGGKSPKTDKGNDYESSNIGKIIFPASTAIDFLADGLSPKRSKSESIGVFGLALALAFGVGVLFDSAINKVRKRDADKFAKTGKVRKNTNKGKVVGTEIGAGLGIAGSLFLIATKGFKAAKNKPAVIGLGALFGGFAGLIYGVVYDVGINRFRKKLAMKANKHQ